MSVLAQGDSINSATGGMALHNAAIWKRLKVANHVAEPNAQCLGDLQERINGDGPVRTLHLTDINRVKISFFSQFLLAQARLLATSAKVITNQFSLFGANCHNSTQEQEAAKGSHKLAG